MTINILNQLVVSVELCSSRAISLNQISFPNEITRFFNRGNWVDLIVLESGKTFNLTACCIPFLNNSLFYSVRKTIRQIENWFPLTSPSALNDDPVVDLHSTGMGTSTR